MKVYSLPHVYTVSTSVDSTSLGLRTLRLAVAVHSCSINALEDYIGRLSDLNQSKVHSESLSIKKASI